MEPNEAHQKVFQLSKTNEFILQVDFPAFTVCSAGFANQNLAAGFYKEYLNFLEEHDAKVNATPYYVASIFERYFEVLYQCNCFHYKHVIHLNDFFEVLSLDV
jgi:hypothetical protein